MHDSVAPTNGLQELLWMYRCTSMQKFIRQQTMKQYCISFSILYWNDQRDYSLCFFERLEFRLALSLFVAYGSVISISIDSFILCCSQLTTTMIKTLPLWCWCCLLLYQPLLTISFCRFYFHSVTLFIFFLFLSYSFDSFLPVVVLFDSDAGFFSFLRQGSFHFQGGVLFFSETVFFSFFIKLSRFVHFPILLFLYGLFIFRRGIFFSFRSFLFQGGILISWLGFFDGDIFFLKVGFFSNWVFLSNWSFTNWVFWSKYRQNH